ncbi:RNA-guided endonuclease InsQ/TnpB family protein [Staphylothermus hellenicus]|uniref:Transposase, IS605 OrfB family n=1 Tax=Staphylothermus hellenicus (strain DSM 12710 / JCM 10830 / BK20S6-10-b1 / P8) TaxID=591019 RepID=D7D991_STAHD|nr:RNA-guided endonuclease TnpB family protein [Staphylothermus hellenicus]ADI32337.1 transposase, IS605 OrfB family [Staphylothermus hellenicus DSM 12710]
METIKSYKVPINAPKDLIKAYFEIKKKTLNEILKHINYSKHGKAHLKFGREDRRRLRNKLLKNWEYAKHYVDSAINSVISLVKSWITLHNKGRAKKPPSITRKTVYIKTTLFKVKDNKIRITIKPRQYLEVDLSKFSYLPKDYDRIGGLILQENKLIITFKKNVEVKNVKDCASFDANLTNVTGYINGRIVRYDLRKLYHIHRVYEEKRRRIQKLDKTKPKTSKRLMEKYSRREWNRARDIMHKLTTGIARMLTSLNHGVILEDLKNIKERTLRKGKDFNRKISKWNARTFQYMLEYKLRWLGLPVKYVNPAYSSQTCPLCSGRLTAYGGRLMKCTRCGFIWDRDVVAVLNLRMRGLRGCPERGRGIHEQGSVDADAPQSLHRQIKAYAG